MDEKVEITRKREDHYACGCSTTHIELAQSILGSPARCAGHDEPIIRTITTNEYLTAEQSNKIRLPRRPEVASQ
jgi:hypothetical protein